MARRAGVEVLDPHQVISTFERRKHIAWFLSALCAAGVGLGLFLGADMPVEMTVAGFLIFAATCGWFALVYRCPQCRASARSREGVDLIPNKCRNCGAALKYGGSGRGAVRRDS